MSRLELRPMFSSATLISILPYKCTLEVGEYRSGEVLEAFQSKSLFRCSQTAFMLRTHR